MSATATSEPYLPAGAPLPGMRQFGMIAGVLGVVLGVAGYFMSGGERFFQAYLVAYTFWMGVVLGCLALLMVQHLSGGVWGIVLRRPFEAAVRTIPYMAALFLPIAFGMHSIFEWSRPEAVNDPIIQAKALYLNVPFFYARAAVLLPRLGDDRPPADEVVGRARSHRRSRAARQVVKAVRRRTARLRHDHDVCDGRLDDVGQPALVLDHLGMLYTGGQGLSAFAFGIIVLLMLAQSAPLNRVLTTITSTISASCCSRS